MSDGYEGCVLSWLAWALISLVVQHAYGTPGASSQLIWELAGVCVAGVISVNIALTHALRFLRLGSLAHLCAYLVRGALAVHDKVSLFA